MADPTHIEPRWPAPATVVALCTTRLGGVSAGPFASFNLARHVGDDAAAVRANRDRLAGLLPVGTELHWLQQVHGTTVVRAGVGGEPQADAHWSDRAGRACAVLTADCLPVLFCSRYGDRIAAAHAGWRGLAAGVLEATVCALGGEPSTLLAWLGPAIGPAAFEVGPEVREAFLAADPSAAACFVPSAERAGHFCADLYGLARLRLRRAGVEAVYGGGFCTYRDAARFYSYRRDGTTGRMASVIALV